jgi:hypothetical protein
VGNLLQKYKKSFLMFLGVETLIALLVIYGLIFGQDIDLSPIIPLTNAFHETMFIFIAVPLSSSTGAIIGGYALSPIFLFLHKTIYPKAKYGIQETGPAKKFKRAFQGYYPSLLAFNLSSIIILLAPKIQNKLLNATVLSEAPTAMIYIFENLILLLLTIALSMLIFSPGWFLIDAGVVYSTEELVKETDRPVEGRTVGGVFNDYLRGYSGFGVAFSYLQIIVIYFSSQISAGIFDIASLIGWLGFPFYFILAVIPTFILLDLIRDHRIQYVRRIAANFGIKRVVKIYFE